MAGSYTQGEQAAAQLGDFFNDNDIAAGVVASGTGAGVVTGLGFTPDWVLFEVGATPNALSWSATSTTLTLTGRSTTTAATISWMAGNIA